MTDTISNGELWRNGSDNMDMIFHVTRRMNFHSKLFGFVVQNAIKDFFAFRCNAWFALKSCPNEMIMETPIGYIRVPPIA